ncbi:gamma-glutamyl-gamma-aminobutyrate hydrolase family protein [Marinomonas algicola]|uniref:gamma-glutamyl-gamma-aminobutyrate hydrolase family protein n=1 Tax=Marinomonas algicola TaxID=2773454 RepID=UPI00174AB202|nr:gamma-glutamyl-gamma-aminobutyrate hydrolase family protein [Marinomonas algicola]
MSKRIGITQRVEVTASYGERRDCLDQQWFLLLESLGFLPVPVPNSLMDVSAWCRSMQLDGFILSGGNDLSHLPGAANCAPDRDRTESALLDYASLECLPILGVCRGMQFINHYMGGSLSAVTQHAGTRHLVEPIGHSEVFNAYAGQAVNSFHNWGIPSGKLGNNLVSEIVSPTKEIEAYSHETLPWIGIMWHPEREQPFSKLDTALLTNLFRSLE